MRAGLYARVSTEEQTEGYSIDAQRRAFQRLCESKGWTPYREYVEAGKSAHTDDIRKRPVFKEAIDAALAGEYDVLVVHKIDTTRQLGVASVRTGWVDGLRGWRAMPQGYIPRLLLSTLAERNDEMCRRAPDPGWRLWWRRGRVDCLQFAAHSHYPACR